MCIFPFVIARVEAHALAVIVCLLQHRKNTVFSCVFSRFLSSIFEAAAAHSNNPCFSVGLHVITFLLLCILTLSPRPLSSAVPSLIGILSAHFCCNRTPSSYGHLQGSKHIQSQGAVQVHAEPQPTRGQHRYISSIFLFINLHILV